ncbi:MAG: hypothetical protein JW918_04900 [Anaerolineae bacterium]|nr:hypothetical protein [Anaerolineae bacterium]
MSDLLEAFQHRHQEKLVQLESGEDEEALLDGVRILIADLRDAGASVAGQAGRGQLRALVRFWTGVVYERAGAYPETTLLPLDPANARSTEEPDRRAWPPLVWILVGGAAAIVIAVGLVAIARLSRPQVAAELPPASTPAPAVRYATLETLTDDGVAADTFCLGVREIVAEFNLGGVRPETAWRWEVQREGEVVASQPEAPWGQDVPYASFRIQVGGGQDIEPGRYTLLAYAEGRVVGARSFQVLGMAPRAFDLQVSDVAGSFDRDRFGAGARVLYLGYAYEGWCPGLDVSAALYYEGTLKQEYLEVWHGSTQGLAQVVFQAPDGRPFPAGSYEIAVSVDSEEQGRVSFMVGEEEEVVAGLPAFGDITVALGVQPDGAPVTAQETPFGWATRVVHAVFDYEGMSDGVRWSVVWTRNGTEIAREDYVWDAGDAGSEGAYWVALAGEDGEPLGGGNYTVTLYINGQRQSAADFRIYYRPE